VQITPAVLDAIFYNFNTLYQGAYARYQPWYTRVAAVVPSTSRENRYAWMRLIPRLREWVGERILRNVEAAGYTLVNKDWESTVELDRNEIQDEQLGVFSPLLQMMGEQAARLGDDLVVQALQSGNTNLCFDGQSFFNASHPVGDPAGSTYQNLWASGMALNAANFTTVRQTMMAYRGEDGKPLMVTPNLLVVPPQLEVTARQILQATYIAPAAALGQNAAGQNQSNVLVGMADILVIPELASEADAWYLLDNTKPIKPFVYQLRKAPTFTALTDPTTENVFMRKKFIYGVDARSNAGYSLPFLAARAKA
jgi:phage major head subunit gpT-like protein